MMSIPNHRSPTVSGLLRLILPTVLGLLALPDVVAAQTLDQTLIWAYQNNPQIQSERARQRTTDEEVTRALAGYRPTVDVIAQTGRAVDRDQSVYTQQVQTSYTTYSENKVHTVTRNRRDPHSVVVEFQQPIYDGGKTPAAVNSAEWLVKRGRAALQSAEAGVLSDAVTAYYDLYRDQTIVDMVAENTQALERQLAATRARYKVKDVTGTDIAQSEARLARGISDRTLVEGNLAATRSSYLRVVGMAPGKAAKPPPLPADVPKTRQEALSFADNNPDVVSATFAESQARSDIDQAYSALNPNLSLNAAALRQDETDQPNYARNSAQVLLQLKIPLYDGGVSYSRIRGAKQTAEQRRNELENTRNKVIDQIERAWQGLVTARSRITSINEQKRASEIALDSVSREVLVGTRSVLDQLNAVQELLDAKVGLVRAQHDEAVAVYSLLVAIGRFNAEGLNLPVDIYDAKANYEDVRSRWFGTGSDTPLATGKP